MLRILKKQMQELGLLARENFVDATVKHLHTFTPEHAKNLGDLALQRIVETGIKRARHYGFTQRGPVRYYIEMMFLLGSDFDTDPQFSWISSILNKPWAEQESQVRRACELLYFNNQYLDVAAGPRNQYAIAGLRRAMSTGLELAPDPTDIVKQILQHFEQLAPEKCSFIGRESMKSFIEHGLSAARTYQAQEAAEQGLIVLLMFGLGHGCLTDPQYPWIGLTFERRASNPEFDVFGSLRQRTRIYLEHALENLSKRQGN